MKRYLLGFLLTGVFSASPVFSQEQVIEEVIVTVTAKEGHLKTYRFQLLLYHLLILRQDKFKIS